MTGTRGPIPARSEERRRRNEPETPVVKTGPDVFTKVEAFDIDLAPGQPEMDEGWHELAKEFWRALATSPEAVWMTSAGWAVAKIGAEQLSRELKPQVVGISEGYTDDDGETHQAGPIFAKVPMKGAAFAAHQKLWASLGLTEGDRRRMGHEITLHQVEAEVTGPAPAGTRDIRSARSAILRGEAG